MINRVMCGDCLDILPGLEDSSVDMVLCDLPYGTTQSKRDVEIDLDLLWDQYLRVCKENAAIVLFAHNQFTFKLALSKFELYRYKYVWIKNKSTNHLNSRKMPLRAHEDILVFYRSSPTYNPQFSYGHKPMNWARKRSSNVYGAEKRVVNDAGTTRRYPNDVLYFDVVNNDDPERICEFQKPVDLCEFLIRTYTNPGDVVLDNAMGSGSVCLAARNTGRLSIGIEIDSVLCEKAYKRLSEFI